MSVISAVWTEDQALSFDDSALAASEEGKAQMDLAASGYIAAWIQIAVAFGATPQGPVVIKVKTSSDSGTAKDTEDVIQYTISPVASTTVRKSFAVRQVPYVEVGVENTDPADSVTISGKWAGLKYNVA